MANVLFDIGTKKEIGRVDDNLEVISGNLGELMSRIPRTLPFRLGGRQGDTFSSVQRDVAVGQPGYMPALRDWLVDENIALYYEE